MPKDNELHIAAQQGNLIQVHSYINKYDINAKGGHDETALIKAAEKGHLEVVQLLLGFNPDVNLPNEYGITALIRAAHYGHAAVVKALIKVPSLDINHATVTGATALAWAALKGHAGVVEALVKVSNLDINNVDNEGNTPMHIAAKESKDDVVIVLINHGADYTLKNKQGHTCFDLLRAKDKPKVLTGLELTLALLEAHNYLIWFVVVQLTDSDSGDAGVFTKLLGMVEVLVGNHPSLAHAKDAEGRAAVDVASKPMKLIMQSVLIWHGRYHITETRPEHTSPSCFVFKGVDEQTMDPETHQPMKVALKLIRLKSQFQREITTRLKDFSPEYVVNVMRTYPQVDSSTLDSWPDEVVDVEVDEEDQLTKANAEKFYILAMPLADRNLFVALKQERWAGKNMKEVRHVFVQLVRCVEHMHEKGVLHADLKTLNIVRTGGQWKLVDLHAACEIGKEPVGHRSSSAYVPPEAIHVDEKNDTACVRSVIASSKGEANYELLTAHPSFDIWSLGCILYQMCTVDVKPLLQGGQDDNLISVRKGVDNLFTLAEWSPELKAEKLADVPDKLARNLLSQMLQKDPLQRPSLARVLAHPFLSGRKVARLVGEKPKYDLYLSYRSGSDLLHAEKLYQLLMAQGFKVYWDNQCLEPGVEWEQGFCEGLVSSRAFVPLFSRGALNHPDKDLQNFSKLTPDSNCDNLLLEYRLAVELQGLGLIEKIFPIFIGNLDATTIKKKITLEYSHYFGSGCHPSLSEITVKSVEEKLRYHLDAQALGTPIVPDRTIASVVGAIAACQGAFIVGFAEAAFADAVASIAKTLTEVAVTQNDGNTPMHIAALQGNVDVFVVLINHGADYTIKNKQGLTCFDLLSAKDKPKVLTELELNVALLEAHDYLVWFVVVQVADTTDVELFTKLLSMVEALVSNHPTLAAAKNAEGIAAVDVASKPMKWIMQSILLWHGRYHITEHRPEYISGSCVIFRGVDEHTTDKETKQPMNVALKVVRSKSQFQREISMRSRGFSPEYVVNVMQTHPHMGSSTFDSWPEHVVDRLTGQLTKANAEKFYMLAMPLADRNLFVALKQECWAGRNMKEVRHVFVQLVRCVEHMHEKGILHGDIKTLNIVRTAGQWKLVDLDAACVIGKEPVGIKYSSAYVPPECIYVDEKTDTACVRSVVAVAKGEANYALVTAHPSFDVWSLGCILYQMCTVDVKPLMQGSHEDQLGGVRKKGVDNLISLAEWSPEYKAEKLADVPDKVARNLLSQMLHRDPFQRPPLARVLAHSFLSGRKVARLLGEKPKYDVYFSCRGAADLLHVEKLYHLLTLQGFKVFWDNFSLVPGVDWEQGFCEGLVNCRAFVPVLSRDAINHPEKDWQNFSKLTPDSKCDNVYLEHRLAVEMQEFGLIEKIFPIFIGNSDTTTLEYSHYFGSGCHPVLPEVTVKSVEEKLRHHLDTQALGTPIKPNRTVKSVVDAITAWQGAFIVGPKGYIDATFSAAAASIAKMLTDVPVTQGNTPRPGSHGHKVALEDMDVKTMISEIYSLQSQLEAMETENTTLKNDNTTLKTEVAALVGQRKTALAFLRSSGFTSADALASHMDSLLQG